MHPQKNNQNCRYEIPKIHNFSFIMLIPIGAVFTDEELPVISINFVSGDVIDLDENPQMIRAEIEIKNYDPHDGYHFMEIIRSSDHDIFVWYANEAISETELLSALEYLISQGTIDVVLVWTSFHL